MTLKLSQLIAEYGDDKVQVQYLDQCGISLDYHRKKGTTITFGTNMNISSTGGTEKFGLVVWLDRKRVAEIVANSKMAAEQQP